MKLNKSLFIDEFKEKQVNKVKFINEKKDRVTVLHIENLTKLLYLVLPKTLIENDDFKKSMQTC